MHKDLSDIKRIAQCLEKKCSIQDTRFVLNRICCKTTESTRNEKYKEFEEKKEELVEAYRGIIGQISLLCKQNSCSLCTVSKWCNYFRKNEQKKEGRRKGLTYADFFCGAGGLSLGFHRAGFKMSLANDIQECCIDTISLNHPEVPEEHIIAGDINCVLEHIEELSRYKTLDVVVGGPPCQGFSTANRQRIIDDPRNRLYKSFVKAIKILNPYFFVMENVRGMLGVKNQIINDFEEIGFSASARLLNAKNFGIPQNRERIIFIGNRLGIDNEEVFERIISEGATMKESVLLDAIDDLPSLFAKRIPNKTEIEDDQSGYTFSNWNQKKVSKYVDLINKSEKCAVLFNHKARYNNDRDIEIFSRLNPGDNSADPKIADIMPYKRREKIFKDKYYKLEPDKPCKTITAHMKYDCNMYIHPFQSRGLTPREAARIQSYPDDYFFRGAYTKTYMQVGNSVPPLLGEIIAGAIKSFIKEG